MSLLAFMAGRAPAHVEYVTDEEGRVAALRFLLDVLSDPVNLFLLAGGFVGALAAALLYLRYRPARRDVAVFRETMREYRDLLPWLVRLGFGLPMVGAGFVGYLFSPLVPPVFLDGVPSRLFPILVGFALLFGVTTRAAAATGLVAYLTLLPFRPELLLSAEYPFGFLAVVLLGSGRPSADHMLQRIGEAEGTVYGRIDPVHRLAVWFNDLIEPYEAYVPTVTRVGLGVSFAYLGVVEKLANPGPALAVVNKYDLTAVVPVDPYLWVVGAGLTELGVGLLLVAGLFTRAASAVSLFMFTLTLFGLPDDPVLAHVTLFAMASLLLVTGAGPYSLDARISTTGSRTMRAMNRR